MCGGLLRRNADHPGSVGWSCAGAAEPTRGDLDAANIRQLLRAGERYPDLAPHLKDGVAIAIDGEIFQDAWLEPIPPDSEVHVIPQIVGG